MKIHKLTASFGKLNHDTIEFNDGLNVVYAPNESGKSTWCAFIRAMLYGVDSAERAKTGYLPDKIKYAPWSGAPMEGTMELTSGGKNITLTRLTKTKSGPMRELSAVYTGTNTSVPGLDGADVGELLTGVPKEVFRRSAFVEQGGLAVTGSPELERRIAAIVTTGEEGMSYSEADERLRAWQRKRRYNRRGELPVLEEQIVSAKRGAENVEGAASERENVHRQLMSADARCALLEEAVAEGRKKCRRDALDNLTKSRSEMNRATDEYNELYTRARADRAALDHCTLGDRAPENVIEEVRDDKSKSLKLKSAAEARMPHTGFIFCLMIAAIAIAALVLSGFRNTAILIVGLMAALGGFIGAALCMRSYRLKRARAAEKARDRLAILAKYNATSEQGIDDALEEFRGLYSACATSEQEAAKAREKLEAAQKCQAELESTTLSDLDFSNGGSEAARLGHELNDAKRERERLSAELARLDGGMEALGDPVIIRSSIDTMEAERNEIQKEYDAISLAVEVLREADGELQSRFSPELGRKAAEYMSLMTNGKYDTLLINRDFTARAGTTDGSPAREAEYLSGGTLDLLYLAVRLAVCELALPEGEKCPLILDDVLVNFDPMREKQAVKLLTEIAKERQVILFTCKNAEDSRTAVAGSGD